MSKFQLVSGIIFSDGTLIPAGKVVDLDENADTTKDYLKRGSIKPYVEGEDEAQNETKSVEGETVKEFELNSFTYKQIQTVEGIRYTQNDVEVSEDAFVSALQIFIREEQEARQVADREVIESDEILQAPVVPGQPTQEQIDADLKTPGV